MRALRLCRQMMFFAWSWAGCAEVGGVVALRGRFEGARNLPPALVATATNLATLARGVGVDILWRPQQ